MNRTIRAVRRRIAATGGDQGIVAIWTALLIVVFMGMAAIAVDISRWYVEVERIQKTVDAAALSGAVYMPGSLDKAQATADTIVEANGWDPAAVTVVGERGGRSSQFRVTMTSTVDNAFGAVLGVPSTTITRSAVGEYTGPAPLGSPCNVHGNEPGPSSGSALPIPVPGNCSSSPEFWSAIVGPEVYKTQGDRFSTRKCGNSPYQESGCATSGRGGRNAEFDPKGYVITVRVTERLAGALTVQLYDPAYVETGQQCGLLPAPSAITTDNLNVNVTNAKDRYRNNSDPISGRPSYCTGDEEGGGLAFGSEEATVTSFGLLKPTDTYNPFDLTANAASKQICAVQYPGFSKAGSGKWTSTSTATDAAPGSTAIDQLTRNSQLTRVFHQWVNMCTIPGPVEPGDYYLRVRTNVAQGNPYAVFTQQGDNPSVVSNGHNRFSVRAVPTNSSDRSKVSVSPYDRMPIFANSKGRAATFNLIRVLPGNAGQGIDFSFYDVGDAAGSGTMTVLPPIDAKLGDPVTGSPFTEAKGCTKDGYESGDAPNCSISGIFNDAGWNGQAENIWIPVPANYTCDFNSIFGCWWRVRVDFGPGSQVHDQTTWTATLTGQPVRLTE